MGVKTALNKRPQKAAPFGLRRTSMKVVTMRNGFIIETLLALGGALPTVGNQGWFGTEAASAASPQEKT
jgi:hypothetical protein